jgi:hypothetical protein
LVAGAVAGAALPEAGTAAPRRTSTRVGTVVAAYGAARVEVAFADGSPAVTVPTDGFPEGWQLRAGDKVVVTDIDGDFVAGPLVTRVTGALNGADSDVVRVADTAVSVRPATLRQGTGSGGYEAYYIENANGLLPECVALRPHGTKA